jgi:hypothetical protein
MMGGIGIFLEDACQYFGWVGVEGVHHCRMKYDPRANN